MKKEELRLLVFSLDKDKSQITVFVTRQSGETIKADRIHSSWWPESSNGFFTQAIVELIRRKMEALSFDFSQSEIDGDSIISNAEKLKNSLFESTEPVDYETPDGEYYIEITYDEFERAIQDKIRSSIPSSCGSFDLIVLSGEKRKTPLVRKMFTEAFPDVSQEYIVCFEPEQDYAQMEQTVSLSVKTTPESAPVDSMKSDTTSDSIEKIATSIATKTTTASAHSPSTSVSAPRPGVQSNTFYTPRTTRSQYQTRNISNLDFWDESESFSVGIRADGTVAVRTTNIWFDLVYGQYTSGPFKEFRRRTMLRKLRCVEKEVDSWENVRKIAANNNGIFGITNKKRCLFSTIRHHFGKKLSIRRREIVDIFCPDNSSFFAHCVDGTGLFLQSNLFSENWEDFVSFVLKDSLENMIECSETNKQLKNIRNISFGNGNSFFAGIELDGTVFAYGYNAYGKCDVQNMYDVTAIVAGSRNTYGLKRDGTVVAVGNNDKNQLRANGWTGIRSLYAIGNSVIGVRNNGKVLALGENYRGRLDVSRWEKIKEIKMFHTYTLGLQEDGTLLSTDETVLERMHDMGVI